MAYVIGNINTLDTKPSVGIGVSIPFTNVTAFSTVYTTKEQLKYNLINFLLTNKGERLFNPTFGANIRAKLFEQITQDSNEGLRLNIINSVENYFPNVEVVDLSIKAQPDYSLISLQFSYRIKTSRETDDILINLQNG